MNKSMPRRDFLLTAGAAAVAIPAAAAPGAFTTNPPPAPDASKQARLFPGICAYSYLKYFKAGSLTMEDFILKAVELQSHSVDITTYWLKSLEPEYLTSLRRLAFRNSMALSGIAIRCNMCQSDAAKRAEEVKNIQNWVDAAEIIGAPHVRVFGGEPPKGATEQQAIEWVAETWKSACDYSAKKGITLGIETHSAIPVRASTALEILHRVDSPYAGINLDISNFEVKTDDEMYSDIQACIPHATHVHIRDVCGFTKRPIDLDRVWRMFAQAGYKGFLSCEYEAEEDPSTGVPKLMNKIKTLCRKYSTA